MLKRGDRDNNKVEGGRGYFLRRPSSGGAFSRFFRRTFCGGRVGEGGFTLIELIVAMVILAIGLLATSSMLVTGMRSNSLAQNVNMEVSIAYSVLDEFLSKDSGDTIFNASVTDATYDLDTLTGATTRVIEGVTYSALYTISIDTPVVGTATVSTTVNSTGRSITLSTIKRTI